MTTERGEPAPRGAFTPEADYREALERRRVNQGRSEYLARRHWQAYGILSFRTSPSAERAQRAGVAFVTDLGPKVYGAVASGAGDVGGRYHIHVLLGGLWTGIVPPSGIDFTAVAIKAAGRRWPHGEVIKLEPYDPNGGAAAYLPDHHEIEIVRTPRRHRPRKRTAGSEQLTSENNHERRHQGAAGQDPQLDQGLPRGGSSAGP